MKKMKRTIALLLSMILITSALAMTYAYAGNGSENAGAQAVRTENNAYLPFGWVYCNRDDNFIDEKLELLTSMGIKTVYFTLGALTIKKDSGNFVLSDKIAENKELSVWEHFGRWLSRADAFGVSVIPVIDCSVNGYFLKKDTEGNAYSYLVSDAIESYVTEMTTTGFVYNSTSYYPAGIHFDCEPFRSQYHDYYLSALRLMRGILGDNYTLSSATPAYNGAWSDDYLASVASLLDMVNPMVYDSNGPSSWGTLADGVTQTKAEYIQLARDTCLWYNRIISENNLDCEISPSVPSYADAYSSGNAEGWPEAESTKVYYHLNYNSLTGETLETTENCITGIRQAVALGADITRIGVWNFYYFCGDDPTYQTSVNPYYDPEADMLAWMSWVEGDGEQEETTTAEPAEPPTESTTAEPEEPPTESTTVKPEEPPTESTTADSGETTGTTEEPVTPETSESTQDSSEGGSRSLWDIITAFFKKIIDFFKGLF